MNKTIKFLVAISFLTASGYSFATIENSAHDLTSGGITGNLGTVDLCAYCHTPHSAQQTIAPLWDRATSGETFIPYASGGTIDSSVAPAVANLSKACLSCHDGVTAFDALGAVGATGTVGQDMTTLGGTVGILGADLSNDHPIGVDTTDAGIDNPVSGFIGTLPTFGGLVECASCHNVHEPGTNLKFLRLEDGSLCQTCHNK